MSEVEEVIILVGGFGTRLSSVVKNVPKPLASVANRPFLDWVLSDLAHKGFRKVILAIGHQGVAFRDRYGDKWCGLGISYSEETEPLGTGGAIKLALKQVGGDSALVLNGDTYVSWNRDELFRVHRSEGVPITLVIKPMKNFDRYGTVEMRGQRLVAFHEKRFCVQGCINGGVYLLEHRKIFWDRQDASFSFEKKILEESILNPGISGLICDGPFIDIGVPEDYELAQQLIPQWADAKLT